jgi:3-methyl-2-oxobutanoate hydroxymethyltransferase
MTSLKKIRVPDILKYKSDGKKIAMVTVYDASFAKLVDQTDIDMVLVGDSLGMVIQGHSDTIPVTLDDMIYHCRAVSRGIKKAHISADLPFMSNKLPSYKTVEHAALLMQKGNAESVKIEGGKETAETIFKIVSSGIPVIGHVGLTPQSVHAFGGFKIQGKSESDKKRISEDAVAVAEAGAFCIVLEGIPPMLADEITKKISIPTIGIGAGPYCDGQVLVLYDLLGMNEEFSPKFLKKYANLSKITKEALNSYSNEVKKSLFPTLNNVALKPAQKNSTHKNGD